MNSPPSAQATSGPSDSIVINLRNPAAAAFWAWLWPGAGHLYQGRTGKGILFMVCILGIYFFGLGLGAGRVVYASFDREDFRYPYLLQVAVGAPALPALVQYHRVAVANKPPLVGDWLMTPPKREGNHDQLSDWHFKLGKNFELGTLYTMIAGLLNILVIFDAYGGPAFERELEEPGPESGGKDRKGAGQ